MTKALRIAEGKHNHGATLVIKINAKILRRNMTDSEKFLWLNIKNKQLNGYYFRRQHPYGIYILDFYCFRANLAIEVDGEIHLNSKEYDMEKDRYLESAGLKVMRFTNKEVMEHLRMVVSVITKYLDSISSISTTA